MDKQYCYHSSYAYRPDSRLNWRLKIWAWDSQTCSWLLLISPFLQNCSQYQYICSFCTFVSSCKWPLGNSKSLSIKGIASHQSGARMTFMSSGTGTGMYEDSIQISDDLLIPWFELTKLGMGIKNIPNSGTGREWKSSTPEISDQEWELFIPGNSRDQEFLLTPATL